MAIKATAMPAISLLLTNSTNFGRFQDIKQKHSHLVAGVRLHLPLCN